MSESPGIDSTVSSRESCGSRSGFGTHKNSWIAFESVNFHVSGFESFLIGHVLLSKFFLTILIDEKE